MYDGCGKVCRSKAALTVHQKRLHRAAEERVRFPGVGCERVLETEVARENHERKCMGDRLTVEGRIVCGRCEWVFSRTDISEHRRRCEGMEGREEEEEDANNNDMQGEEEAEEDNWAEGAETEEEWWLERFDAVEEAEEGMRELETIAEEEEEDWHEGFEVEEVDRWRNRRRLVEEAAAAAWAAAGGDQPRRGTQEEEEEGGGRGEDFSFEGFEDGEDAGGGNEQEEAHEEEEEVRENEVRGAAAREVGRVVGGRVYVGKRSRCQHCGRELSHSNMARHERRCRLVWDPGGGPHPV